MIIDSLDTRQRNLLHQHLGLVIETNKILNLTRIADEDMGVLLHIEDSLSCLSEFSLREGPFLDIGTGGGFPGIPLAIATGRPGVLIDSIQKKANAVRAIVNELGLEEQIQVVGARSEEYAEEASNSFTTVVMRAVSSLPATMELATPFLVTGGTFIAMRGREDDETLQAVERSSDILGLKMISIRRFALSDEFQRTIILFEKTENPQMKLPRRPGMASKKPILCHQ